MKNPVVLNSYSTPQEAYIIQGMLEANGIESYIEDKNNLYVPIFNGVDLIVDSDDLQKAEELLSEHHE